MPGPYFIITSGATGAGKTQLIDSTVKHLGIETEPLTKILVDDLVENSPNYKKQIDIILTTLKESCKDQNENCMKQKFDEPTKELFDNFGQAYFASRGKKGCRDDNNVSCDEVNDKKLKKAIIDKENIVFEFTGQYIPTWLLNLDSEFLTKETNYTIVFTYSLVELDKLTLRNKKRAYNSYINYIRDRSKSAFRLPKVSKDAFTPLLKTLNRILIDIYTCVRMPNSTFEYNKRTSSCPTRKIDRLLVFDNNADPTIDGDTGKLLPPSPPILKFDSETENENIKESILHLEQVIAESNPIDYDKSMHLNSIPEKITGGKYKSKKYKKSKKSKSRKGKKV